MLEVRRIVLEDLLEVRDLVLPAYGADPSLHRELGRFWRGGLEAGAFIGLIIRECTDGAEPRLAASALTMVARPEFVASVVESPSGGFGEHALRWSVARRVPWLTAEECRHESAASGVAVAGLHDLLWLGATVAENPPPLVELRDHVWHALHRGIRFSSFALSAETSAGATWLQNAGQRLIRSPEIPTAEDPAVFSVRREDLPLIFGSRVAKVFSHVPPRLRLTPSHRELLELALLGLNDEETADAMCISLSAIKKRWIALYDHLDSVAPERFGGGDRLLDDSGRRGSERRRHLLNYLRNHREEMNPQAG